MKYAIHVLFTLILFTQHVLSDQITSPEPPKKEPDLAIVIDAGSTGSRLYIYQLTESGDDSSKNKLLFDSKVSPGISTSINDIRATNQHLDNLFNPAQRFCYQAKLNCANAPLHFLSTGGVRLERRSKQQQLFQLIRNWLEDFSIFKNITEIRTISGEEEAILGWMSAYDHQVHSQQPIGPFFELGGASLQFAYITNTTAEANVIIEYTNKKVLLNVGSWLGFGVNEATNRVLKYWHESDISCYPKGFNSDEAFDYPKCFKFFDHYLTANINFNSLNEAIQRTVKNNKPIALKSAFKYFFQDYFDTTQPSEFQQALKSVCQLSWQSIRANPKYASMISFHQESACANGTYILSLFKVIGLPRSYNNYIFTDSSWTQAVTTYWRLKNAHKITLKKAETIAAQ